jgi:Undecaprenyl-phosphate galactose phosphotransferase WbaP
VAILHPTPISRLSDSAARAQPQLAARASAIAPPWQCAALLAAADLSALLLAASISVTVWHNADPRLNPALYAGIWPVLLLFPLAYAASSLYPGFGRSAVEELRSLTVSTSLVYAALAVTVFLLKDAVSFSRAAFLLAWAQSLILVPAGRALLRLLVAQKPWWGDAVAIVGDPYEAAAVADSLARRARIGLKPAMILDPGRAMKMTGSEGIRHAIVVASPRTNLAEVYRNLSDVFPRITVIPDLNGLSCLWAEPRDLGGTLGLEIRQRLLMPWPRAAKRAVDLCILGAAAIVSVPIVLLIAAMIKLNTRGPVFYGQRRCGRGGRPFIAWKFRTMVADAGGVLEQYLRANPALRAEWKRDHKLRRDPRVTLVGRLLRRTSLDELPQLWNVLRGQMSVVGPRPIVTEEIARYGSAFDLYKKVPPGLTGLWQVSGRNNLSYDERVECDLYYIRNWSPWLDLYILARTVAAVLLARGAY